MRTCPLSVLGIGISLSPVADAKAVALAFAQGAAEIQQLHDQGPACDLAAKQHLGLDLELPGITGDPRR